MVSKVSTPRRTDRSLSAVDHLGHLDSNLQEHMTCRAGSVYCSADPTQEICATWYIFTDPADDTSIAAVFLGERVRYTVRIFEDLASA